MTVVVDSSFVLALGHAGDVNHAAARSWIETADEELVTSPLALARLDALVARHLGPAGTSALRADLDAGVYTVRWWADALSETLGVAHRQPALDLTQASLLALAQRLNTPRIATFDHDQLGAATLPDGRAVLALPADR